MAVRTKGGRKLSAAARKARAAQANGVQRIEVGFFSTAKYPDGTPVTNVAAWNEFGTQKKDGSVHIPERPFFRNALPTIRKNVRLMIRKGIDPQTMAVSTQLAEQLGAMAQGEIQDSIVELRDPKNAPVTVEGGWIVGAHGKPIYIEGKKSDNPLVDEGVLVGSVTYKAHR